MVLLVLSTAAYEFVSSRLCTACGIPPTSMYLRNMPIMRLWTASLTGSILSKASLIRGMVMSSPCAQRNSSKSIGCM